MTRHVQRVNAIYKNTGKSLTFFVVNILLRYFGNEIRFDNGQIDYMCIYYDTSKEFQIINKTLMSSNASRKSLINIINNNGPRTIPCGTPEVAVNSSDLILL